MIHRNKSVWVVVLAFVLIAAVAIPITVGAQTGGNEGHLTQDAEFYASLWGISPEEAQDAISRVADGEEALMRDAKFYASDWGIDVDEASERLKLQEPIGELNAALAEQQPDTYAGLWIQHAPEYRVVVQFTEGGEKTIQPYIENGPLARVVEVRTVGATLKELEAAQLATLAAVRELGIPFESAIIVSKNRVELYLTEKGAIARREASLVLPSGVDVIMVEQLGSEETDIYGVFL